MEYDAAQLKRMNATYMVISKALERGAPSPGSAVSWAARAGRGEDVSVLASLTCSEWRAAQNQKVAAHSNSQLAQQLLDLLGQAVDGADPPDDEFAAIFPPDDMPRTTQGNPKPSTVPTVEAFGTTNRSTSYASSRYDARPGTMGQLGEIEDERADSLFPQAGMTAGASAIAEQEAREREAAVRAGALDPYSDDDLLGLLFGDTS